MGERKYYDAPNPFHHGHRLDKCLLVLGKASQENPSTNKLPQRSSTKDCCLGMNPEQNLETSPMASITFSRAINHLGSETEDYFKR